MMTYWNNIVLDAISEERTFVLITGEHEMEISYKNYSIIINYSLERKEIYEEENRIGGINGYHFSIESIYVIDTSTDEESTVEITDNIEKYIYQQSEIEDTDTYF